MYCAWNSPGKEEHWYMLFVNLYMASDLFGSSCADKSTEQPSIMIDFEQAIIRALKQEYQFENS